MMFKLNKIFLCLFLAFFVSCASAPPTLKDYQHAAKNVVVVVESLRTAYPDSEDMQHITTQVLVLAEKLETGDISTVDDLLRELEGPVTKIIQESVKDPSEAALLIAGVRLLLLNLQG